LSEDLFKQSFSQEVLSPFVRAMEKNAITCMKLLIAYGCQEFSVELERQEVDDEQAFKNYCLKKCRALFEGYNKALISIHGSQEHCINLESVESTFGECMIRNKKITVDILDIVAQDLVAQNSVDKRARDF
jgi:hypothetical protein